MLNKKGVNTIRVEWSISRNEWEMRTDTSGDKIPDQIAIALANQLISGKTVQIKLERA